MPLEFIYNGQGSGAVADRLLEQNGDVLCLRPWIGRDKRHYVVNRVGFDQDGKPIYKTFMTNAPATLRKDEWIRWDDTVVRTARAELRLVNDLVAEGLTYGGFDGMAVPIIQHQTMTDAGDADLSMDGLRQARRDRPLFDLVNLPLPIAHADFHFPLREIMVSRNNGTPLNDNMVENSTRKVAELTEKLTLGTLPQYSYGGGTIYGLLNQPQRLTKVLTAPTAGGWTPATSVTQILDMIQKLSDKFFNGPYGIYLSSNWSQYLDNDYSATYAGETLRTRLAKIDNIKYIRKLDYFPSGTFRVVVVQLTSSVIQIVQGLKLTTLQWDSHGGMQKNFKVMQIVVPRLKANTDGNIGICDGSS
jgi:hypothetical protein